MSIILIYGFAALTMCSCSRKATSRTEGEVNHGVTPARIERCMQSDELWVDRLIYIASEGIKAGKTSEVLKRLQSIEAAIDKVQLVEDGVDCIEPVLLDHDKVVEKLLRLAEQSSGDINVIRFMPLDEKGGVVRAMILLIQDYRERQAKGR